MKSWLLLLTVVWLTSCGPTIRKSLDKAVTVPRKVAVLPPVFPESLRAERAAIIKEQLESKLANAGFLLVDRAVVARYCPTPECPRREELAQRYGIGGFIEAVVFSASKNNFLAGYVDELRGELALRSLSGQELFRIAHFETERGGLLFNSGQLIEGLRTQVEHSGDASFEILAAKFAREVVNRFPRPSGMEVAGVEPDAVIARVSSRRMQRDVFEICAEGSKGALAAAVIQGMRTTLREVTPGRYCGVYWLGPKLTANVQVEVRSHYGHAVRSMLLLDAPRESRSSGTSSVPKKRAAVSAPVLGVFTVALNTGGTAPVSALKDALSGKGRIQRSNAAKRSGGQRGHRESRV